MKYLEKLWCEKQQNSMLNSDKVTYLLHISQTRISQLSHSLAMFSVFSNCTQLLKNNTIVSLSFLKLSFQELSNTSSDYLCVNISFSLLNPYSTCNQPDLWNFRHALLSSRYLWVMGWGAGSFLQLSTSLMFNFINCLRNTPMTEVYPEIT